ncbi:tyrosine-type recombinase/integrase [Pseudonocardia sp. WMMC193]|uniref:tyrosine-type recombinase/integrase n=1 Tax=Pseudonocardia sp. WMMC193 TaxID=2911965 RepID=UPI001F03055F|nr:tyrosine-type recombinase/integrase [Pseudonocardia sp. WMMC193]MCF7547412.1 tyrosine-type recombinase/integrase [Pseudonocardia sp. WMMC193]MCF7553892.1 tyrosine-type recombinase/integrase [Pseudonocardia sp. WMMC193]MCF7553921.1 tyrosine-type recombinase/integrase [Pseudonocardia sp. WMMC193]MCF7553949.1 tyrosine-type recombinase/integrase [Pseudonocardia sp. WMMC193]
MPRRSGAGDNRARGSIETRANGSLRVSVYAGIDPVTGRRHYLRESVPAGPKAWREAEDVKTRLLAEVSAKRNPRTKATIDQLLERYLDQFSGSPTTLDLYRTHVRNHIKPVLGHLRVSQLDPETLDSFYGELLRCRSRCAGRRRVDHHSAEPHDCNDRCTPHQCRPLAPTTVRHIHFILSGAYKRAVRWRWLAVNPMAQAEPPPPPRPNPQPPTAAEAARIVNESWRDPDWGTLVWTAMTTGARRGEFCGIRVSAVDLDEGRETIWLRRAIRREPGAGWTEADLKTHQQRRIALDAETVAVLRDHLARCRARATAVGAEYRSDAYLFSAAPDGSTFLTPDSVTQRYDRMVARLGIETTIHKLRHYSATELIAGGVDPRTVAGRLGHGGGGTTTLKAYTAWVSEADQRAAKGLGAGMPQRPAEMDDAEWIRASPRYPYQRVAAAVARDVADGRLIAGDSAPSAPDLVEQHGVSLPTAKRSLVLLTEWGMLAREGRGQLRIVGPAEELASVVPAAEPSVPAAPSAPPAIRLLTLIVRHRGSEVAKFSTAADPTDPVALHRILAAAVRRAGGDDTNIRDYEMDVKVPGESEPLLTFVTSPWTM